MDNIWYPIIFLSGVLLASLGILLYFAGVTKGETKVIPKVDTIITIQYNHENTPLFEVFRKEGINISPEQEHRLIDVITNCHRKPIGLGEDAHEL